MNFRDFFLNEAKPFTTKRDLNWLRIKVTSIVTVLFVVGGILLWPSPEPQQTAFLEKSVGGSSSPNIEERSDPTQETLRQLQDTKVNSRQVHSSLDYLYKQDKLSGSGSGSNMNRNSGMILARNEFDSRTQLSPGIRIPIRLSQGVNVSDQAIPVIGIVITDVQSEYGIAIPSGSKAVGEVSFESSNEKISLNWRSIILPDGRERPFSAIGIGKDGHAGLDARIKSESFKNAIGQTLTKFVGAYAAGSINTGAFGANPGGNKNGLRNAIAETATERATVMGEELQKEKKWAELYTSQEILSVLNQPFSFRDPGGVNGQ